MLSVAFVRRTNQDGTQTSSCSKCQNIVTTAAVERDLVAAENLHICYFPELSDSVLSSYLTLTQRVLIFLEGHSP
jgi:hypothetical protein